MIKSNDTDILIIDDETDIRLMLAEALKEHGYRSRATVNVNDARLAIEKKRPDLLILDIWMRASRIDGLEFLRQIKRDYPSLPVLIISGHGNIDAAVEAIKCGAYDFLERPFKTDRIITTVKRALETAKLTQENNELKSRNLRNEKILLGESDAVQKLSQTIEKVSILNTPIVIYGETGTGKKTVAKLIHDSSTRTGKPFTVINCAGMPSSQQIDELLGAESKSNPPKIGAIEISNGGTLVINEISQMPRDLQEKLYKILRVKSFSRLGSRRKIATNFRLMVTSSKNLESLAENNFFNQNLFDQINRSSVIVPPLRERLDDLPTLVNTFQDNIYKISSLPSRRINPQVMTIMQSYAWPGNIYQLRNMVEWLMYLSSNLPDNEAITVSLLPKFMRAENIDLSSHNTNAMTNKNTDSVVQFVTENDNILELPLKLARESFEREYLHAQVQRFSGNISKTANFIGMDRTALHRKLKQLNCHSSSNTNTANDVKKVS
ncbi:MAG: sigma-54-dependent transcriptional regulator [Alphaproteobacteria bacterium]